MCSLSGSTGELVMVGSTGCTVSISTLLPFLGDISPVTVMVLDLRVAFQQLWCYVRADTVSESSQEHTCSCSCLFN